MCFCPAVSTGWWEILSPVEILFQPMQRHPVGQGVLDEMDIFHVRTATRKGILARCPSTHKYNRLNNDDPHMAWLHSQGS